MIGNHVAVICNTMQRNALRFMITYSITHARGSAGRVCPGDARGCRGGGGRGFWLGVLGDDSLGRLNLMAKGGFA